MCIKKTILFALLLLPTHLAMTAEKEKPGENKESRAVTEKLEIHISQPLDNALIHAARVDVRGKIKSNVPLKRVFGQMNLASVTKNDFIIRNILLEPGTNIITAGVESRSGTVVTNSITVVAVADGKEKLIDPVQLKVNANLGFAPLEIEFTLQTAVHVQIEKVIWDFDGDGVSDLETKSIHPIKHSYPAGDYAPVVTVQTKEGEFSSFGGFNLSPWLMSEEMVVIHVEERPIQLGVINITDPVDIEAMTNGNLYVLSSATATLTEFDAKGNVLRSLEKLGTKPCGFGIDSQENIYVAISGDNQVIKLKPTAKSFELDPSFHKSGRIGNEDKTAGAAKGQFNKPYDVTVSPDGGVIYVSDLTNHRLQSFRNDGTFLHFPGETGMVLKEQLMPHGLACDSIARILVADSDNHRLMELDSESFGASQGHGSITGPYGKKGILPGEFQNPCNVSFRWPDAIFVADTGNDRIQKLTSRGALPIWTISTELGLKRPQAVSIPENLREERIYIADTGNNRIVIAQVPRGDPALVWKEMMDALVKKKDKEKALSYFTSEAADNYRETIDAIGLDRYIETMKNIKEIIPVYIEDDKAEYRFEDKIQGQGITFLIHFYKERGQWRIHEF